MEKVLTGIRIVLVGFIFLNLALIFSLSAQNAQTSNSRSDFLATVIAPKVITEYSKLPETEQKTQVFQLNEQLREYAHSGIFLPLGLLMTMLLHTIRKGKGWSCLYIILAVCFCALCGMLDESHQNFVDGRGFEWLDVGMDCLGATIGSILGLFVCGLTWWIWKRVSSENRN